MIQEKTWRCEICGYIHEGEEPPETCPICGVGREYFSELVIPSSEQIPSPTAWRCTICDYIHHGDSPPLDCPICSASRDMFVPYEEETEAVQSTDDVERVVILGAGIAGLTAAERVRKISPQVMITLVSSESNLPYYRLNLTRFLAGEVSEASLLIHQQPWFDERQIEWIVGEAVLIDRKTRQLHLRDQRNIPYDRLVLANGSHPFVPPILGITRQGVHVFRTLEDTREILQQAKPGSRCLCIGGGLLGLETAGALRKRVAQVTVLEGYDWLLPRQLAEPAGKLLQKHLEGIGISVRCGIRVKEIVGDESVGGILLSDGEEIPADLVVLSTGVRPNSYLARQSDLVVNSGIIVDDQMKTSDPYIFAAGDVAEHRGLCYGIWPAAFAQAVVAGTNAVKGNAEFHGFPPSNQLKVLDVELFSIGQIQPDDASCRILEEQQGEIYHRFVYRDGRLVGAILYGNASQASLVKTAIEQGTQILELPELLERFPKLRTLS